MCSLRELGPAKSNERMYMPLGRSEKLKEWNTGLGEEDLSVGRRCQAQDGSDDKRERMEAISLYSKSDPQGCRTQPASCRPQCLPLR